MHAFRFVVVHESEVLKHRMLHIWSCWSRIVFCMVRVYAVSTGLPLELETRTELQADGRTEVRTRRVMLMRPIMKAKAVKPMFK